MNIEIRKLENRDAQIISSAFSEMGWNKPASQYKRYFQEQENGDRLVLVAEVDNQFAGYLTIVWQSNYPHFKENNIPEIVDLNVIERFRQQKIGTKLMDKAEEIISKKSNIVGIGVGLANGYNAAQRMYVRRGYIPDGRGIQYDGKPVKDGQTVAIDDSLELHLTKKVDS